jgi:hypothetical protein
MELLATALLASYITAAHALPPLRRDEWQPSNSSITWPSGAPIPAPTNHPGAGWQPQGNQTCIYLTNAYQWTGYGINLCNPAGVCGAYCPHIGTFPGIY